MNASKNTICDDVLIQLRKIVRAMEVHSRQLQRDHALTAPQLVLLREIDRQDQIAMGALARQTSLSNATVTGIVDRLEQRGLVSRIRSGKDRRQVLLTCTELGQKTASEAPALFQEQFITALSGLAQWEQAHMLAALSRLATMMDGASLGMTPEKTEDTGSSTPDGFLTSCQMLLDADSGLQVKDQTTPPNGAAITVMRSETELPESLSLLSLARFLNAHLRPYEDTVEDIARGLRYALTQAPGQGGFVLLAHKEECLAGALVMLETGMSGYVPGHLLLFVAVDAAMRGRGIGAQLIRSAQAQCPGDIKLHVEYHNPARRLYERLGFSSKYAEMRWTNEPSHH